MIQKFLHRFLLRRHFWRHATFNEIAELYASRMLRILALHLVSLFIAVYLYKNGFSLLFIAVYYSLYFFVKIFMAFPAAQFVARFGPKHGILFGNLSYIPALILLTLVPDYGLVAVIAYGVFQAWSATIYDLSYLTDFSKVKSLDHAGKEIGFMHIVEKLAGGLSPLVGSIVATFFGAESAMWLASALFAVAALPLLMTAEPTRLNQKLRFKGFPWKLTWRSLVAESAIGADVASSGAIWSLFLALVIFSASPEYAYLAIGTIATISIIATGVVAYIFGVLIDKKHGARLLRYNVFLKSITHAMRPFTGNPIMASAVDVAANTATTGYAMAFTRGMFDMADRSKYCITYLFFIEMAVNFGASFMFLVFAGCVALTSQAHSAFMAFYILATLVILLIKSHHFPLYRK